MDPSNNQDQGKNQSNSSNHFNGSDKSPREMVSLPADAPLEGVLSAEEILLIEKSGLSLEDAIRVIESSGE